MGKKKWHLHGGDDDVIFARVNNMVAEKKPGSSSHNVLNFQAKLAKNGLFYFPLCESCCKMTAIQSPFFQNLDVPKLTEVLGNGGEAREGGGGGGSLSALLVLGGLSPAGL